MIKRGSIIMGEDGLYWRVEHVHQHFVQAVRQQSPIMASMRDACPEPDEDWDWTVTGYSYSPSGRRVETLRNPSFRRALLLRRDIRPVGEAVTIRD